MVFTQKDKKRIGKNFAAIRKAYGFISVVDFAIELNYQGLSEDILRKIEGGKYQIKESTIRLYGALTGFAFERIAYDDLGDLEPNSLVFKRPDIKEFYYGDEAQNDYMEFLKTAFPIVTSEEALKSDDFKNAYDICINKIYKAQFDENDVVEAVNTFYRSALDKPIIEAYVNILSVIGCLYIHYVWFSMDKKTLDRLSSREYENIIEFQKNIYSARNNDNGKELSSKVKRSFLDGYNQLLTSYMVKVNNSQEYKDYAYYFLAARYYFGIMDNEITKISDSDMNTFGHNMLDCLKIMGNKYATNLIKFLYEE